MDCPSCGHANRESARFCEACGALLARTCPSCKAELRPAARFCDICGQRLNGTGAAPPTAATAPRAYTPPHLAEKILRDRAALAGERKQVTVLFCDFANSTPLAERLGPEGMHALLNRFFELALAEVHRYEGTVNQFLGDGFMALFGAPVAHEDHARRAVLAALGLQRAVEATWPDEERPALRLGLNTGLVVVGAIGDNLRMDYTAIGDTTNLAARMEQAAAPGAIYLTRQTHRLVSDYIECESLGPLTVKGKNTPVTAYRALREKGIRTRIEAAASRGLTPLVSRTHELVMLRGYAEQAARGRGQVVFITGEAGIGKSRLLLELRRSLDPGVRWLEGHCISYGSNIPYLPVIDVLKGAFGIEEGDDDARIIERVDAGTAGWDAPARATVPYLKFLLSVDPGDPAVSAMDPLERRAGIFDALRAALVQASRDRPLVLVVEDLHWVDEKSEEALAALLDVVAATPVLLLLTARPGYSHKLGERSYFSRLALGQLTAEESGALAGAMLGTATLTDELRRLIAEKAEGNPFYIEEVTRSLLETGVLQRSGDGYALGRDITEVHIPDTIQDVILARIDRLAPPAKESIQLASVIGREFTVRLLKRISDLQAPLDDLLSQLKALELIYEKAYFPELAYMFKHALTHDVAYSTLLTERRMALHRVVAIAIEELYSDRLAEHYETLAHHYEQAGEPEKALDYLVKSGDKAAAAYANREALDFYGRALTLCEQFGDANLATAAAVIQKRKLTLTTVGDITGALADCDRLLVAARRVGDRRLEGKALAERGFLEFGDHDFETAEETLAAAMVIADEGFDDVRLATTLYRANLAALVFHRFEEAEDLLQQAEALIPMADDAWNYAWVGNLRSLLANWSGRFDEALKALEGWGAAAETSHLTRVTHLMEQAFVLVGIGAYQQALELIDCAIAYSDRVGEVIGRAKLINTKGWLYAELQDYQQAYEWNTTGIAAALALNFPDPEIESNARINLGDNLVALGRLDEAEEQFRAVEQIVRNPRPQDRWMLWRYSQHLFHSYGELKLARGDLDGALALAGECLTPAEQSDSRKNIVKARRLRGQVFLARGKLAETEQELAIALEVARAVGNPPQLWKTLATLGELHAAQGRPEDARQAYRDALTVIESVAAGLTDERLRETFLGSAHVQGIRRATGRV